MFRNLFFQYMSLPYLAIVQNELSKERISQAGQAKALLRKECYFQTQISSLAVNCRHVR